MANTPFLPTKESLQQLYLQGKSLADIANTLNCSVHKITYWMRKYDIPRRSHSDAAYLKFNPHGDPFRISDDITRDKNFLYGLGVGIYWGEGNKASPNSVRVGNTDSELLKVFRKFLIDICHLNEDKFGYSIVCFNDTEPKSAQRYWSKELSIVPEKFGKIVQIPTQGKGTYKKRSKFGVCTITVGNMKLKNWILNEINQNKLPR